MDQEKILTTYRRRLQKLKEIEAQHGRNTEPEILIEIEDLEAKIKQMGPKAPTIRRIWIGYLGVFALLCICTSLIGGGVGLISSNWGILASLRNFTPTPTLEISPTLEPVVTNTVILPTASLATDTSTPPCPIQINTVTPSFFEGFDANINDWRNDTYGLEDENKPGVEYRLVNKAYQIKLKTKEDSGAWYREDVPGILKKNFQLKVDAKIIEASELVEIVIVFRAGKDSGEDLYRAGFRNDNSFDLGVRREGKFEQIEQFPTSNIFDLDVGSQNSFIVAVEDSHIIICANNTKLFDDTNNILTQSGEVGIGVLVPNGDETAIVEFDNLVIDY